MDSFNLLPDSYVKQQVRRRVDRFCAVLCVVVVVGLVAVDWITSRTYGRTKAQYQAVLRRMDQEGGDMDAFTRLCSQKRKLFNDAQAAGALEERVPRSLLLALVVEALPPNLSLGSVNISEKLRVKAQDTAAPGDKTRGKNTRVTRSTDKTQKTEAIPEWETVIQIVGHAERDDAVTDLLVSLEKNPLTQDVHLSFTDQCKVGDVVCRTFKIDWTLRKNPDVLLLRDAEKATPVESVAAAEKEQRL